MRLTSGVPCDGVTQTRKESADATAAVAAANVSAQSDLAKQQADMLASLRERMQAAGTPRAETFARIMAEGSKRGHQNNDQWQIKVSTQPFRPGTTLYDARVQANLIDASGRITPLQLSNRQLFVNIESRYAWVDHMGAKAVVCLTAKDPRGDKVFRLTQRFSIETTRVYWNDGGNHVPGDQATFLPSEPATLTEASDAVCK